MPYVKPLTPQPHVRMTRLLKGYGLTPPKLAEILGVSPPTARRRLENPAQLTVEDLVRINRFGHVPLDEIREAIG